MKKIILIGSGGSGKSTLARQVAQILDIPVFHLDRLHWRPNWVPTPANEWRNMQLELCSKEEWVIDGNYGGTLEIRLQACDSVIFLDLPRWLCVFRIMKRYLINHGKSRPDMTVGCEERINWDFFKWVWEYPFKKRPIILEKLGGLGDKKNIFILKSKRQVGDFVSNLKAEKNSRR